jgi:outer membrane protein OmpA-like peptidoglycan-associated protein/thioredoxin-related protein
MKNIPLNICLLILFGISAISFSQNQGIKFEQPVWKKVLEKAKKENKNIFVDCHTESCGWCRWIEKHTYVNDTVGRYYNSHFICVSFDVNVGDGIDVGKKYGIGPVPTLLYLNSNGEILIKYGGALNVKEFIKLGKDAFVPEKQYSYYTELYKRDSTNGNTTFEYFNMLNNARELTPSHLDKYFATKKDTDLTRPDNWKIIYSFSYPFSYSKTYPLFEKNLSGYYRLYRKDSVERVINDVYEDRLMIALLNKDTKKLNSLKEKFRKYKTADCERILLHTDGKLKKLNNTDFNTAIEVEDSIVGPVNVSLGYGQFQEFCTKDLSEENSAWFKFTIDYDTTLTFDIVPIDSLDDYDFVLFKCSDGNCIDKNGKKNIKIERYCLSYCTSKSGMTGLSKYVLNKEVGVGPGPAYVSAVYVKAGETYYLMVDYAYNVSDKNPLGFKIYFYNYFPKKRPITLNNVFFESNKSILKKESFLELDKLVGLLMKTQMVIEIRGHTDNEGDEQKNQSLSEERAKAVVDYLVSKGVNQKRLFYRGFGSTRPIGDNATEEGKQKNRRVEFVMVLN